MSLVWVMRFLTLGSTPSMPNQPPKIISTGNAFLTSKEMISKFPQLEFFLIFFPLLQLMCACVFFVCSGYILETVVQTLQNGTRHLRGLFFLNAVEVRGAPAGDLFSLYCYSTKRDSHKRLMRQREGWGGGERAGSDELQPKRKTHSFSSAAREGGNSQLCRHNMTMNVRVGCEVPSCCDWQAGEEEKEMPLFPRLSNSSGENNRLRQHGERRKRTHKRQQKRQLKSTPPTLLQPQHT